MLEVLSSGKEPRLSSFQITQNLTFIWSPTMSIDLSTDRRISLCTFTFADGRHCRTPRAAMHQHLCTYHARKDAQARAAEKVGHEIAYDLSGGFITANDVAAALGHLFSAVAQGNIKPKTANTLAYLGQTMVQAIQLSRDEYIETYGRTEWRDEVAHHLYPEISNANPARSARESDCHSERSEETAVCRNTQDQNSPEPVDQ
jgi:hypothetical protein